jgi:hypothetical protein
LDRRKTKWWFLKITIDQFNVVQFSSGLMPGPVPLLVLGLQVAQNNPQGLDLPGHRVVELIVERGVVSTHSYFLQLFLERFLRHFPSRSLYMIRNCVLLFI